MNALKLTPELSGKRSVMNSPANLIWKLQATVMLGVAIGRT
jgi:hypothetical protein